MTTQDLVAELKSVTYDLMSLLERESTELRTIPRDEYEHFLSEKSALSMQYEQIVVKLRARGEELRELPEEERAELRELTWGPASEAYLAKAGDAGKALLTAYEEATAE